MTNKIFILLTTLCLFSCTTKHDKLYTALTMSGNNRIELEKVLKHYSQNEADSLKLRAAKFLIENMPGHHTYGGEYIDNYIKEFDSLNTNPVLYQKSYFYSFPLLQSEIIDFLEPKYDIENITSKFLIENIDFKFKLLEITPWGKDIDFNDFCEYLLPYRIDIEPLISIEYDTLSKIINRLQSELKKNKYCDITMSNSIEIWRDAFDSKNFNVKLPNNETYNMGDCGAVAHTTMEKNRLTGIPTMIDFAPHWANANGRHSWCKVIDTHSKDIKINYINRSKIAKVYRKTYSHNKSPKPDRNFIPYIFNPFNRDVTDEYIHTANIIISYKKQVEGGIKNGYLSVFNQLQWQPIAWSEFDKKGNANFNNLGKDIVYLPVYYEETNEIVADYPFILNNNGGVTKLIPNHNDKIKLHIERKSPIEMYKLKWDEKILGAVIEASNDIKFTNPDTISIINNLPYSSIYDISINSIKDYRYVRIVQNPLNGQMWLSELSFNDINGNRIDGKLFIQSESKESIFSSLYNERQDRLDKILIDEKYTEFAIIDNWIGIDLKKQIKVSSINIGLRSDGNYIYHNNTYELLYHNDIKWVSLGIKKADNYFIEFNSVPSGALYWLRNLTEGKEERIFTYENGRMKFW